VNAPHPPSAYGAATPGTTAGSHRTEDASVGELLGAVTRDMSTLMRQELALAKAELREQAGTAGKATGALGGAGLAAFFVLMFGSIALWSALSAAIGAAWAGLLVALVWAVIAAALFAVGRSALRRIDPTPARTVDTLGTVPDALRGQRGGRP
jgi:hypothetical protein